MRLAAIRRLAGTSAATLGLAIAATFGFVASATFELDGFRRYSPLASTIGVVTLGIVLLLIDPERGSAAAGVTMGVVFTVAGCYGVFHWLRRPHRVTLNDSGVLLTALARQVQIPWADLESVRPPRWDLYHMSLRWRRRRGRSVTTDAFPELHRMLVEIERQAPHAYVSS